MEQSTLAFYDELAPAYHLIFGDWTVAVEHQRAVLCRLLPQPADAGRVLDCACGIGTQVLGLAVAGYTVEGTDISAVALDRAISEAKLRSLDIGFRVDDMRTLATSQCGQYGVVLALDNALPHLDTDHEVGTALASMYARLRPGGMLLVSVRDYGPLMERRAAVDGPTMFWEGEKRRIVHQVWDWQDDRHYVLHLYITRQRADFSWSVDHFLGHYRAMTPAEVAAHARAVGFSDIRILLPDSTGYHQPILMAVR